ncbi:MAG: hypothetical protein ACPG5B_15200 [Chitinophagales bacterium]
MTQREAENIKTLIFKREMEEAKKEMLAFCKEKDKIRLLFMQYNDASNRNILGKLSNPDCDVIKTRCIGSLFDFLNKEVAKTPDQIQIYCYVITSTQETIKQNIGDTCFCLIEDDRYHKTDCDKWKPYSNSQNIADILKAYKRHYRFSEWYIHNYAQKMMDACLLHLDDNLANSIAILDVLSIDKQNEKLVSKFDTKKAGGLIMPFCRTLANHNELYKIAEEKQKSFQTLNASIRANIPCDLYHFDLPKFLTFQNALNKVFHQFKIKNQSTTDNPLRSLNMNFQ